MEAYLVEMETEDRVEAGRRQVQRPFPDRDLVTVLQERVAPGIDFLETRGVSEQLVARRNEYPVPVERDPAQAAIPAASLPVDIDRVPVDRLPDLLLLEIDQVDAAVALALPAATDDGSGDEPDYVPPNLFLSVSQNVRGLSCARCWR